MLNDLCAVTLSLTQSRKSFSHSIFLIIRESNQEIKDHEYHFKRTKKTKNNDFI